MRKVIRTLAAALLFAGASLVAGPASAQLDVTVPPPPPAPPEPMVVVVPDGHRAHPIPTHISVGNQQFEANVDGVRAFLETIKSSNPSLYQQLALDVDGLEARANAARALLYVGIGAGVLSTVYAFAGRSDCNQPSLDDPAFGEKTTAWGRCNDANVNHLAAFTFIGAGAVAAGALAWWALTPGRQELFDFANKHNRLSPEPLRFQIGYDPAHRIAVGGATLRF